MENYEPKAFWSHVAEEVEKRGDNVIAGDDNPYYRYKRDRFLDTFLDGIDFKSREVLEIGVGPGGNLERIALRSPDSQLYGVDISLRMLALAAKRLTRFEKVHLEPCDGSRLPFRDQSIDISFTVTVLQHVADAGALQILASEMQRVTREKIVIFEDIGDCDTAAGHGAWTGRTAEVYRGIFQGNGFKFEGLTFLNTMVSRTWNDTVGALLKRFAIYERKQGDPLPAFTRTIIGFPMPIMKLLDTILPDTRDLAMMTFTRTT
jgi:SAM-dependent methyltransferase